MSQSANIILNDRSKEELLKVIAKIRAWDNGHNYPIKVFRGNYGNYVMDSIDNVEAAINNGVEDYLKSKGL